MNLGWVCANVTSSLSIFQLFSIGFRQEDLFHMIARQSKYQFMFLIASLQKIGKLSFLFSIFLSSFFSFFLYSFLLFFFNTWTEVLVMILIRANEIMWLLSQFLRKSNSLIFQWNHNLILEHKVKLIPFSCRNRLWSPVCMPHATSAQLLPYEPIPLTHSGNFRVFSNIPNCCPQTFMLFPFRWPPLQGNTCI